MTNRAVSIISIAAFLVLGVIVLTLSPHNMRNLQGGFLGVISPFLKGGSTMEKKYHDFREGLKTLEQLEEENKRLAIANKDLNATNQIFRGLEAENNKLRSALGYGQRAVFKLVPARITARDASTWYNAVIIDRGEADGIKGDMAVLTEDGLVGKTGIVSAHAATVILVSDETCRVAVTVEGSIGRGIVKGERTAANSVPELSLNFLSKQAILQPGQKVFSSGVGGVFPAGVQVGVVKEYKLGTLDGHATIIPAVDLTTLEDVFVVVSNRK